MELAIKASFMMSLLSKHLRSAVFSKIAKDTAAEAVRPITNAESVITADCSLKVSWNCDNNVESKSEK